MSNLEVIKPEGEQPQPRTWLDDMAAHNAEFSRPVDKRLSDENQAEERAGAQPD